MAKYEVEVIKEVKNEYKFSNEEYLKDLFDRVITDFVGQQVRYQLGTKWVRVYDSQNNLVLIEYEMLNRKEFLDFCKIKGYAFKKK